MGPSAGKLWLWLCLLLTLVLALSFEYMHPGFYYADDQVVMFVPAYQEVARAWLSGEVPLLSRYSWFCGCLAAEYQYAVFSLFHQLLLVLSLALGHLPARAAFVSIVYLLVSSAGGYQLGRRFGLNPALATALALCFGFNGYMIRMGARTWICVLVGFAWLPWVWLALQSRSPKRWHLALPVYLCVAGGFPQTTLMAGLLIGSYLLRDLWERNWEPLRRCLTGALAGGMLAAPGLFMLLELASTSRRPQGLNWQLVPTLSDALGAYLPLFTRDVLGGLNNDFSCGVLPAAALVLLAWAALRRKGAFDQRHLWFLWALLALLCFLPSPGGLRYSFRWLALLNPGLALMGLRHLQGLIEQRRAAGSLVGVVLLGGALAWLACWGHISTRWWLPAVELQLVVLTGWWLGWSMAGSGARRSALTALAVTAFLGAPFWLEPHFPYRTFHTPTPDYLPRLEKDRLYWSLYSVDDLYRQTQPEAWVPLLSASLGMNFELRTVQGYSPLLASRSGILFGWHLTCASDPKVLPWLKDGLGPQGLLSRLGIEGLILSEQFPLGPQLEQAGWQRAATFPKGSVWHCPVAQRAHARFISRSYLLPWRRQQQQDETLTQMAQLPEALDFQERHEVTTSTLERYGSGRVDNEQAQRNDFRAFLRPDPGGGRYLLSLPLPFIDGYRAYYRGRPVPTMPLNFAGLGVEIADEQPGELVVVYRPLSLWLGLATAGLGCLAVLWFVWKDRTV